MITIPSRLHKRDPVKNNMSGLPDLDYLGDITCEVVADHLRCNSLQSQAEWSIPLDDVVCVLSDHERDSHGYRILFLQQGGGGGDSMSELKSVKVSDLPSAALSSYVHTESPYLGDPSGEKVDIHVVISTQSGMGRGRDIFSCTVQPLLWHLGLDGHYKIHETQSPHTITELAQSTFLPRAQAGVSQTIVLLSGDGGLADLIDVFHHFSEEALIPPNIALIPTGTGNAMANSTGLLSHARSALMALVQGKSVPIPTFRAKFSPGAQLVVEEGRSRSPISNPVTSSQSQVIYGGLVASWGLHASLVADSDTVEYRRFGPDRFKMAAQELLYPPDGTKTHRYSGIVTLTKLDHQTKTSYTEILGSGEHMYVLASLVSRLEKAFEISPASLPLDGRLNLIHFGVVPPERAMDILGQAYQNGQHVHDAAVTYTEIEGLRIDFRENLEHWRRVCIDGKIVAVEEGGWAELDREPRHQLKLLRP